MNHLIKKTWDKQIKTTYPLTKELTVNAIILFELNQTATDIIEHFIHTAGQDLSLKHQQTLKQYQDDLKQVLPELDGDALIYFRRLTDLIQMVLNDSKTKFPARLHVLVARHGDNAVVIRRGPSKQVCTF